MSILAIPSTGGAGSFFVAQVDTNRPFLSRGVSGSLGNGRFVVEGESFSFFVGCEGWVGSKLCCDPHVGQRP